jgi:hypothetical protein
LVAYRGPCAVVAGYQQFADFRLEPLHTLFGRACAQIPMAILAKAMRAERVSRPAIFSASLSQN